MIVTRYEIRFTDLARHIIWFVPTEREKIKRIIDGLNYGLHFIMAQEVATYARFDQVLEIARCLEQLRRLEHKEWKAKMPYSSDGFSSASSGLLSHYSRGHPSRPVQVAHHVPHGSLISHRSYSARPPQSSFSGFPA
ncbi:uncharacterized protein [Nicotiana tomentosiformis]|uniref:uncharacterized protein n=1 Tax=Nicotiana tomentosiformis TaxID=4098 RepID=UPI00388C6FEE